MDKGVTWRKAAVGLVMAGATALSAPIAQAQSWPPASDTDEPAPYSFPDDTRSDAARDQDRRADDDRYQQSRSDRDDRRDDRYDARPDDEGEAGDASAADRDRDRDARDDTARYPDRSYLRTRRNPAPTSAAQSTGAASLGSAVDACSRELEDAGKAMDSITSVRRMGGRVSVEGELRGGSPFACSVDATGRVRSVAVDGQALN